MRCAKIEENAKNPLTIPLVCGIIYKSPHEEAKRSQESSEGKKIFSKKRKKGLDKANRL